VSLQGHVAQTSWTMRVCSADRVADDVRQKKMSFVFACH